MNDDDIRAVNSVGESEYPPPEPGHVASRVKGRPSRSYSNLMGLVAALLAAAVVVGLIYLRGNTTHSAAPARHPAIPLPVLEQAHVAVAESLLSYPSLEGHVNGYPISLAAAYADAHHIALIFATTHPSIPFPRFPSLAYTGLRLFLEGDSHGGGPLWGAPDNYVVYDDWGGAKTGTEGMAHIEGSVDENGVADTRIPAPHSPVPPAPTASGVRQAQTWSWSYSLPVETALPLSNPHGSISDGPWTYQIRNFELTPTAIYLNAYIDGPTLADDSDPRKLVQSVTLLDGGSTVLAWEGSIRSPDGPSSKLWQQQMTWPRPNDNTTLRLVITGGGGYFAVEVPMPAPARSWPATTARTS